jgi:hypothetical protein
MAYEPRPLIASRGAGLDHLQWLFFDVGRVSVLGGWVVVTCPFGNPATSAAQVFLGFGLLLTLSPAAYLFPWIERTLWQCHLWMVSHTYNESLWNFQVQINLMNGMPNHYTSPCNLFYYTSAMQRL